jgi:hypothetical protein
VFGLVLCVLGRGAALAILTPPWQTPDEPGHYEYARLVQREGLGAGGRPADAELQQEIIADLAATDFWTRVRATTPDPLPAVFHADPFLARSGAQIGDEPVGYYWLVSQVWRQTTHAFGGRSATQGRLLVGRLVSPVLLALAVLIAAWAVRVAWPHDRALRWGATAFVALHPMAAFMGAGLNNDSLALVAGTAGIAVGLWAVRRGITWPAGLALLLLAATGGVLVKKTLLFLWPLALIALILAWRDPAAGWRRWRARLTRRALLRGALIVGLGLIGLAGWLAGRVADRPAAWVSGGWPGEGSRVVLADGPALALRDHSPDRRAILEQRVRWPLADVPAGRTLALAGQARAASSAAAVEVSLRITDDFTAGEGVCMAGADWTRCETRFPLPPRASQARVVLAVGAKGNTGVFGDVYWRDVRLYWADAPAGETGNLLANSSGQDAARRAVPLLLWLERVLQAPRGWIIALARPENYQVGALLRYAIFTALAFAGFWGNFGWLQAPLPWPFYAWLAALCALAAWGWVGRVASADETHQVPGTSEVPGTWWAVFRTDRPLLLCLAAAALILLQTALPMIGFVWQPQGRYLLPALLPIGVCLIVGLRAGLGQRWRRWAEVLLLGTLLLANGAMFWVIETRW